MSDSKVTTFSAFLALPKEERERIFPGSVSTPNFNWPQHTVDVNGVRMVRLSQEAANSSAAQSRAKMAAMLAQKHSAPHAKKNAPSDPLAAAKAAAQKVAQGPQAVPQVLAAQPGAGPHSAATLAPVNPTYLAYLPVESHGYFVEKNKAALAQQGQQLAEDTSDE